MWHGIGSVVYSTGLGLGGVVGGAISENWGWRWAFLALIPLTLVSGVGVAIFLPDHASHREHNIKASLRRIDFVGSIVLVSALVLFLYGLNHENSDGVPSTLLLEITMPIAAALFIAFIAIETHFVAEPVIPVMLLRLRTVAGACLAGWFNSMAFYTLMFYVPLYFQLRGYGPSETGLRILPEPVGSAIGALGAGIIMRLTGRYGTLKIVVLGLFIGGAAGFSTSTINTAPLLPEMYLFINGMGFGGMLTVITLALLSAVDHEHQAVTTAVLYAFRSTGATIGVTASSTLFRKVLASQLEEDHTSNSAANSSNARRHEIEQTFRKCSRRHHDRGPNSCPPELLEAYMCALHATFLLAMSFAIAGFLSGMATKNNELRTTLNIEKTDVKHGQVGPNMDHEEYEDHERYGERRAHEEYEGHEQHATR